MIRLNPRRRRLLNWKFCSVEHILSVEAVQGKSECRGLVVAMHYQIAIYLLAIIKNSDKARPIHPMSV
jgi:hypothetical protein